MTEKEARKRARKILQMESSEITLQTALDFKALKPYIPPRYYGKLYSAFRFIAPLEVIRALRERKTAEANKSE